MSNVRLSLGEIGRHRVEGESVEKIREPGPEVRPGSRLKVAVVVSCLTLPAVVVLGGVLHGLDDHGVDLQVGPGILLGVHLLGEGG